MGKIKEFIYYGALYPSRARFMYLFIPAPSIGMGATSIEVFSLSKVSIDAELSAVRGACRTAPLKCFAQ
jgi:hypothetical protein